PSVKAVFTVDPEHAHARPRPSDLNEVNNDHLADDDDDKAHAETNELTRRATTGKRPHSERGSGAQHHPGKDDDHSGNIQVHRWQIGHHRSTQEHEQPARSEEHTSELQSRFDLVCRLLLEKKKKK